MSGPFKALSEDQMKRVDNHRTEITYRKGETICKQGSFISNMLFIKKGLVKIYLENGTHPTILSVENDGYFIGLQSLFNENVFHYSVEALEETDLCLVDINVFRDLIRENAEFGARIIEYINNDVIKTYNRFHSHTQKQIHGRFAELLLYLKNDIYEQNPFALSITKKDMADIISTSNESVSRLCSELKNEGIINEKGRVLTILDEEKLEQISKFG
jgi:CRP/FNR family transcriptional regulator